MFPEIKLGEVLVPTSRPEAVEADREYPLLGTRWYAGGLFIKDIKPGSEVRAKTLYRVEEGDFVYNRLFAWKGSFATATSDDAGCYVSNEFPCFRPSADRLDGRFLQWYFSREATWNEALGHSTGGTPTSRNRLKEDKFLSFSIPLPPLAEQRRIVARIDALAAKIEEAQNLQQRVEQDLQRLSRSIISDSGDSEAISTRMSELVTLRTPDVQVEPTGRYHFAGVYSFGRGVFPGQVKSGSEFSYEKLTRLRVGDFVYPKLMAWEGALGVVPPECDGLVVSTEFPVFEIDREKVLPEVLDVYFRTPSVWQSLAGTSTGTNVRRRRLNPREFLAYDFPLPPMGTQQLLCRVREHAVRIEELQFQSARNLNALLPAILDRAFKGEL